MADSDFYSLPFDQQVEIFNNLPSLPAPEGVEPDYDHPRARNDVTIAVTVVGLAFTTVLFALRVYSRLFIVKKVRLEDYVGTAGFITYVAKCGVLGALVHTGGFLAHQWDVLAGRTVEISKLIQAQTTLYNLCMLFTKVAILLEWSHLFVPYPVRNKFFWTCHVLIWANIGFFVPGHCINSKIVDTFVPAFNFFIDLVIFIFPQKTIWKLQAPGYRRLAISAIFSSGILTVAFAGARVSVSIHTLTNPEFLWLGSQSVLFGLAEMTFAFWVFCIPAVPKSVHASHIANLPKYILAKVRSTATLVKKPSHDSGFNSDKSPLPHNSYEVGVGNADQINSHALRNMQPESFPQQQRQKPKPGGMPEPGVLRTTDLMASVNSVDEGTVGSGDHQHVYKNQHPWV